MVTAELCVLGEQEQRSFQSFPGVMSHCLSWTTNQRGSVSQQDVQTTEELLTHLLLMSSSSSWSGHSSCFGGLWHHPHQCRSPRQTEQGPPQPPCPATQAEDDQHHENYKQPLQPPSWFRELSKISKTIFHDAWDNIPSPLTTFHHQRRHKPSVYRVKSKAWLQKVKSRL